MEPDDFNRIINELKGIDEKAWLSIRTHIGILISRWARKEKIESDWIAASDGIRNAGHLADEVYARFRDELLSGKLETNQYPEYKEVILGYTREIIREQFEMFYKLIRANDSQAWRKVHERIFIYAAKWLSDRGIIADNAIDIFQESMLTFVEKVATKELDFETSRDFKSYYFRILELKTLEHNRKRTQHIQRSTELKLNHLLKPREEANSQADDRYYYIEKIMNDSIPEDAKYILKNYYFHGEKLSDIAKDLHISDGNCRLKKHHALKKIADMYHQLKMTERNSHIKE